MKLTSITKAASAAAPVLANNKQLPELAAWKARSFWLTAITGAVALANSQGVDLLGHLGELGLGTTPGAVDPVEAAADNRLIVGFMLDCNATGLASAAENLARGIKAEAARRKAARSASYDR